jgi:hypothetical protein
MFESDFKDMIAEDEILKGKKPLNNTDQGSSDTNADMESIFIEDESKVNFKKDILSKNEDNKKEDNDGGIPNNLPFV